jgi:hypothetical protein
VSWLPVGVRQDQLYRSDGVFTRRNIREGDGRSEIPSYHSYLVVMDETPPQCEQS